MKPLTRELRQLSLRGAESLSTRTFSAAQLRTALEEGDTKTLTAFKRVVERDFESGSPDQIRASLDVLSACAQANEKAGLPLVIELSPKGVAHTQSMLVQLAKTKSELTPPLGINKAQVRTESIGKLQQMGVLKMGSFESFATPILETLRETSPFAARSLDRFVATGTSMFDGLEAITQAKIEARKSEQMNAAIKLDGEIGGKKPASKHGPMLWRPK